MPSFPEPLGFSESLEEYVSRCGLSPNSCGCNLSKEYKDHLSAMPMLSHSYECQIGAAYGTWKEKGRKSLELIRASLQPPEVTFAPLRAGAEFDILAEERPEGRGYREDRRGPRNSGRNRV